MATHSSILCLETPMERGAWQATVHRVTKSQSCRDQEGRRGSEEAVPGHSVFPSREPGVSGDSLATSKAFPAVKDSIGRHP